MSSKTEKKISAKSIALGERLYYSSNNNRLKENKIRQENNALITELPAETVKWLRKHRRINCKDLVPITHYREKQLRQMFNGLDFQNRNSIDLKSFKEALEYVRQHMNHKSNDMNLFNNIEELFYAMDEDHSGTIDFKEFTAAVTGSSKSALEKASEYDMEKLFIKFNEYAQMKKREYAIESIDGTIIKYDEILSPPLTKSSPKHLSKIKSIKSMNNLYSSDNNINITNSSSKKYNYNNYKYFRKLFDINDNDDYDTILQNTKEIENRLIENQLPVSIHNNKDEKILKLFIDDYMTSKKNKTDKDIEYEKLYLRARQERIDYIESMKKDTELRLLHQRIEEENKRVQQSRLAESKWSTSYKRGVSTKGPLIPEDDSFKAKLKLNLKVRKEVYDLTRVRHGLPTDTILYGLERDYKK